MHYNWYYIIFFSVVIVINVIIIIVLILIIICIIVIICIISIFILLSILLLYYNTITKQYNYITSIVNNHKTSIIISNFLYYSRYGTRSISWRFRTRGDDVN